jgi:hypothetical protein
MRPIFPMIGNSRSDFSNRYSFSEVINQALAGANSSSKTKPVNNFTKFIYIFNMCLPVTNFQSLHWMNIPIASDRETAPPETNAQMAQFVMTTIMISQGECQVSTAIGEEKRKDEIMNLVLRTTLFDGVFTNLFDGDIAVTITDII